ncbi:hypothetical protein BVSY1_39280 [Bacillus velezensis]|nr:hypothetical protein BVSY1_39280 [Bacillus velezensis]
MWAVDHLKISAKKYQGSLYYPWYHWDAARGLEPSRVIHPLGPQPSKNLSKVSKAFIQSICLFYLYLFSSFFMNSEHKLGTY